MHTGKGRPLENGSQASAPCPSSQSDGAPESAESRAGVCDSPEAVIPETIASSAGNGYVLTQMPPHLLWKWFFLKLLRDGT